MSDALWEKLKDQPVFRGLKPKELDALMHGAPEVALAGGQALFDEGDPGDGLYVVISGNLEVRKADATGAPHVLATVGPGGVLGEMSLLGDVPNRSASAVATGAVRLVKLSADRYAELVEKEQLAALKLGLNLARVMSRRLLLMDERLMLRASRSTRVGRKEELLEFEKILNDWSF